MKIVLLLLFSFFLLTGSKLWPWTGPKPATVDFSQKLRTWDGFGVNYVETAQTRDYKTFPQDYGGFSFLKESDKQLILELFFGREGLRVNLVKMFLDVWHEGLTIEDNDNDDPWVINMQGFDHTTTTKGMIYFAKGGLNLTRSWGSDLKILVGLYGPQPWVTTQKFIRGRDLNETLKYEFGEYLVSWAKYLIEVEGLPVKYISLHNEGEDYRRWPEDGSIGGDPADDYNIWMKKEILVDALQWMPVMLAKQGVRGVEVASGETTNWYRFGHWGYADAIYENDLAVSNLGLITSHGFSALDQIGPWFADWRSVGIDKIREKRPGLHAWVTSTSFGSMDPFFVADMSNNIYSAKVNGIIPWATTHVLTQWVDPDPNSGTCISIFENGTWVVEKGYYYYKQITTAGQSGTGVAYVDCLASQVYLMAFSSNGTPYPDAFVVINTVSEIAKEVQNLEITIKGSLSVEFNGFRTSATENYVPIGLFKVSNRVLSYTAPPSSVTTFYGI
eukprot:TRINITY_DN9632_c0_g1_i1.p1 TRINITY_DN9632_c0_g1~~TRINITY_DN9632_c0_g1_i1.p1  ORF type:complete len:502 (-),score=67.07 TRINITY_DN9632_c0_g1_i1:67-1572(-)